MRFIPEAIRQLVAKLRKTRVRLKYCDASNQWDLLRQDIDSQKARILRIIRSWRKRISHP